VQRFTASAEETDGASESGKRGSGWQELAMEATHLFDAFVSLRDCGAFAVNVEYRGVILRCFQNFGQFALKIQWSVCAPLAVVTPGLIARCSVDEVVCLPSGAVYFGFTPIYLCALSALEHAVLSAHLAIHKRTLAARWTCAQAAT
jgi:hypothetical protein